MYAFKSQDCFGQEAIINAYDVLCFFVCLFFNMDRSFYILLFGVLIGKMCGILLFVSNWFSVHPRVLG